MKLATRKVHSVTVVVEMVVKVIKHPQSRKPSLQLCLAKICLKDIFQLSNASIDFIDIFVLLFDYER